MAKKKDVNIDELDDESGKSGKLVSNADHVPKSIMTAAKNMAAENRDVR